MTEENKAHEKDPNALRFEPHTWNRPTEARPFRTCSYCGSIHPTDLLALLHGGDKLTLADKKYGWPHKFYTEDYNKFYSLHMLDAGDDFDELAALIRPTGVEFLKDAEGFAYRTHKDVPC